MGLFAIETTSFSLSFLIFEWGHFSAMLSRAVDSIRSCFLAFGYNCSEMRPNSPSTKGF